MNNEYFLEAEKWIIFPLHLALCLSSKAEVEFETSLWISNKRLMKWDGLVTSKKANQLETEIAEAGYLSLHMICHLPCYRRQAPVPSTNSSPHLTSRRTCQERKSLASFHIGLWSSSLADWCSSIHNWKKRVPLCRSLLQAYYSPDKSLRVLTFKHTSL